MAVIIAGITAAVSLLVKSFNDAKEKAKETAQAIRDSFKGAFDKSAEAAKDLFDKISHTESANKMVMDQIDFYNDYESRSKAADIKKRGLEERASATDDFDKQRASAKERRDLALQQLEAKATDTNMGVNKAIKVRDVAQEKYNAKYNEMKDAQSKMEDMGSLLDKTLLEQFNSLKDAFEKAKSDAISKGKDSTAYMQTKSKTTSSGYVSYYDEAVTYG